MMLWILLLGLALEAQGQIDCSGQRLTIETSGETVTFPCQFSWLASRLPKNYELVWQLKKNKKDFVVHDDYNTSPANQQQSSMFAKRTYIQEGWYQNGDATLQIKDITESDQGVYTCDILTPMPFDRKICTTITLVVNSNVVAPETDPVASPARLLLFILLPLAVIMVLAAAVVVAVRLCKTHLHWMHQNPASGTTAPSKVPDNNSDCAGQGRSSSLVKDIEDDDLEDVVADDCQCTVTSTSGLLPDNCKK